MASPFESLPAELLLHVAEHIPRPSDLKSLCLASKALRVAATTLLYKHVTFDQSTPRWISLKPGRRMLSKANPGLSQIRNLSFFSAQDEATTVEEQAMAIVLKAIPSNTLRSIECRQFTIDEDVATLLITQQQKLVSIALGPLSFNLLPFIKRGLLGPSVFAKVKDVEIPWTIGSIHDLELYQSMIAKAPLRQLSVRLNSCRTALPGDRKSASWDDSDGLLSKTLFAHLKAGSILPPAQIEYLELENTDLHLARKTFAKYVDLSYLRRLELFLCAGLNTLISAITSHFEKSGAQLKSFAYTLVETESLSYNVVERFLLSFDGLESLCMVGIDNFGKVDFKTLQNHSSTLQLLALQPDHLGDEFADNNTSMRRFYSMISKHFHKLKELALPMPYVQLGYHSSPQSSGYDPAMLALMKLPNLKSLRIFNWPAPAHILHGGVSDEAEDLINRRLYTLDLDTYAYTHLTDLINQSGRETPSPIICFNGMSRNEARHVEDRVVKLLEPSCYVPVRQRDIFGRPKLALQKTSVSDARYFEPDTVVLKWPYN